MLFRLMSLSTNTGFHEFLESQFRIGLLLETGAENEEIAAALDIKDPSRAQEALLEAVRAEASKKNLAPGELIAKCMERAIFEHLRQFMSSVTRAHDTGRQPMPGDTPTALTAVLGELSPLELSMFEQYKTGSSFSDIQLTALCVSRYISLAQLTNPTVTLPKIKEEMTSDEVWSELVRCLDQTAKITGDPVDSSILHALKDTLSSLDPWGLEIRVEAERQRLRDAARKLRRELAESDDSE